MTVLVSGAAGLVFAVSHVLALLGLGWLTGWWLRGRAGRKADPPRAGQGTPKGRHREGAPAPAEPLAIAPVPDPAHGWPAPAVPPPPAADDEPDTITVELGQLRREDWAALADGQDPAQQTLTLHVPRRAPAVVQHTTETTTVVTGPLQPVPAEPWAGAAEFGAGHVALTSALGVLAPEAEHRAGGSRRHPACWCHEYHTRDEAGALNYWHQMNGEPQ